MKKLIIFFILKVLISCSTPIKEQKVVPSKISISWESQARIKKAHIRGLMMVSESVAWASGTSCTVLKCSDGNNWQDVSVKDTLGLDFRDIHGFNEKEAVVMSAGNGVAIYRTENGGIDWSLIYADTSRNVFFDGIDFNDKGHGFAYGDPINGKLSLLESNDFGRSWKALFNTPLLDSNEAGYAASGTGILTRGESLYIATSGGTQSHFHVISSNDTLKSDVPIYSKSGAGIFSISFWDDFNGVAVGGDYVDSTQNKANCAITRNGGKTWQAITQNQPRGYRSCVASNDDGSILITTGRTGSEYSIDSGVNWIPISEEGFFTCALSGYSGWVMGRNGKISKLVYKP